MIEVRFPLLAPETLGLGTIVHENVVPITELVSGITVESPEQIVVNTGVAIASGFGFTF